MISFYYYVMIIITIMRSIMSSSIFLFHIGGFAQRISSRRRFVSSSPHSPTSSNQSSFSFSQSIVTNLLSSYLKPNPFRTSIGCTCGRHAGGAPLAHRPPLRAVPCVCLPRPCGCSCKIAHRFSCFHPSPPPGLIVPLLHSWPDTSPKEFHKCICIHLCDT